jgi:hypothetical protein
VTEHSVDTAPETWHGTVGGYTNHKCRCDACTQAQRDYVRNYRREKWDNRICATPDCDNKAERARGNGLCAACNRELAAT